MVSVDHCISLLEQYNDLFDCPVVDVRSPCDKTVNTQGRHLIDLCKIYSLYIMNGRMESDKNIGHYTFSSIQGSSVIDYCLVYKNLVNMVKDFCVEERTESSHFPIKCHF